MYFFLSSDFELEIPNFFNLKLIEIFSLKEKELRCFSERSHLRVKAYLFPYIVSVQLGPLFFRLVTFMFF